MLLALDPTSGQVQEVIVQEVIVPRGDRSRGDRSRLVMSCLLKGSRMCSSIHDSNSLCTQCIENHRRSKTTRLVIQSITVNSRIGVTGKNMHCILWQETNVRPWRVKFRPGEWFVHSDQQGGRVEIKQQIVNTLQ